MSIENGDQSEELAARRTQVLQRAIDTLKSEVVDRTKAMEDRKDAELELMRVNESLKSEITARVLAESEFGRMFDATPDMMALGGFDGFYKRVNPAMLQTMGYTQEEMLRTPLREMIHADDLVLLSEPNSKLAKGEKVRNLYYRVKHKDGHYLHTEWTDVPLVEGGLFFTMGRNITARIEMEESLRSALASMREAQRIGMVGSWEVDMASGDSEWSDETYRMCGFKPGEVTPHLSVFLSIVHPNDLIAVRDGISKPLEPGEQRQLEYRFVLKDGSVHDAVAKMELVPSTHSRSVRIRGTCQDVTEQRNAQRNQEALEQRVRAGQKMEAVGSLAGGIAHDFNNLLSVIMTYVGFVMDSMPPVDPRRDDLIEVQKATERAAILTRQLLAFGRKQVLKPVALNLNQVATGLEQMLRRIVHEDITLVLQLEPELGLAMADPGQIEQVIMNLVVNARDAMPTGGQLVIETANVEIEASHESGLFPGPHVMLSVADTGIGMNAYTKEHLFEPFFTTKEVGKGTGLGLPTVYGILKQSGGHVSFYSEAGLGSTFRVYLPRDKSVAPRQPEPEVVPLVDVRGAETVLVVEDEAAVRNSAARILASCGYAVLTAANGLEALKVFEQHRHKIGLVLTDMIMPRLSGELLAQEIGTRWPHTPILFMSGYSGGAVPGSTKLAHGIEFIGKPFNAGELTRKVRRMLDDGGGQGEPEPTAGD